MPQQKVLWVIQIVYINIYIYMYTRVYVCMPEFADDEAVALLFCGKPQAAHLIELQIQTQHTHT